MNKSFIPDHTAVRTALWRALHLKLDEQPFVFEDSLGEKLVNEENWTARQDMHPNFSKPMRASIVGRARFVEDLLEEKIEQGISQYVLLGAGLDTFALRRTDLLKKIKVFEIDKLETQEWKRLRLAELKYSIPEELTFVPVDFERGELWTEKLKACGFNPMRPTMVVSTGVSMYLSHEAILSLLNEVAHFADKSLLAMTFLLDPKLLQDKERNMMEFVMKKAEESGTPFKSLFVPSDLIEMAQKIGFRNVKYVSANMLFQKYFSSRSDGLNAGEAEAFLITEV